MAEVQTEDEKSIKKNLSGDFSVLQVPATSPESILRNSSWPKQDDNSFQSADPRPYISEDSLESSQIFASHYALSTAYARVTKKLAEAESRNNQLQMQESSRSQENFRSAKMSGSSNSQANFAMLPNIEASVNQAWEAYNEKCKECQELREEVEQAKQQTDNSIHFSRIQNLQEDVLREKAKQDDVVRKLEKTKMEADHNGKKEILAREELDKEREYQRNIIQCAQTKHKEMEQKIEELENSLANEKNLTADLRKREKDRQDTIEDEFQSKKEVFVTKIRELEEENIRLKEEVSVLVELQHQHSTSIPNRNMNGFPESKSNRGNLLEQLDDQDALTLTADLQTMRGELNELKTRAAEQSHILLSLFQNPKIITLLRSIDQMQGSSETTNGSDGMPVQCTEELLHKRKKTSLPITRNAFLAHKTNEGYSERLVIGSSLTSTVNPVQAPSTSRNEGNIGSINTTVVLKPTEDFIRSLDKDIIQQKRRTSRTPLPNGNTEYNTLYPPMDASRFIHNPSSGQTEMRNGSSEKFSDDFNPLPSNSRISNQVNPAANTTADVKYTEYINGNIPTYTQANSNGPPARPSRRDSLPRIEPGVKSNHFYSALSSCSDETLVLSLANALPRVRPTNPFFNDLAGSDVNNTQTSMQLNSTVLTDHGVTQSSKLISSPKRAEALPLPLQPHPSYLSPSAAGAGGGGVEMNHATPANRYNSSDEDNADGEFEQMRNQDLGVGQPKEFVVAKVVRASDLALNTGKGKRTFEDTRFTVPTVPPSAQMRPPMRAKSESQSNITQSNSRTNRPENRGIAYAHQYPASGSNNREIETSPQDGVRTCPICILAFDADWTETRMNRHINNHFSDDENEMLSFD